MSENKRSLKSYLKDYEESQRKKIQSSRFPTDEDEEDEDDFLPAPTMRSARKKSAKRERAVPQGRPPNVTPPPELGDNLNA